MSAPVERAMLLMQQGRNDLAVPELQKHLATEPEDAFAHALTAMCFSDQEKFDEATRHIAEAIKSAPDMSFAHYVAAYILRDRNRLDEALPSVQEAIRLDPYNSAAFGLLAQIHLAENRHEEALAAAERGLESDPEDVTCQNLRAMALKNLGRHNDAAAALRSALSRDPENSLTHANQGWALLEKNKHEEALHHFQEALRLDPQNEWAREGIVTALKSRYRLYAVMLKYFLWMSKLTGQAQWMVILGSFFLLRILNRLSTGHPEWAGVIEPIRLLFIAFVIFTWIADPLFNLALRLNKYGRLALNRDQANCATLIGMMLASCLISVVLAYTIGPAELYQLAAIAFGALLLPIAGMFRCPVGWPRRIMGILAATGLLGLIAEGTFGYRSSFLSALFVTCAIGFFIGIIGSQFLANFLVGRRVRK